LVLRRAYSCSEIDYPLSVYARAARRADAITDRDALEVAEAAL
jgi:hypothetical protein